MPRCIVVGCTSGYTSNPEKVHFFYVPKKENLREAWQTALRRRDIIINSKQAVCHHHFLTSDIIWKRVLYDEKGNVLGESAPFKKPRLRKDAVPSQFPWFEETEETQNMDDPIEMIQQNCENMHNVDRIESHLSFDQLVNILNKKELNMPSQWSYTTYYDGQTKLLILFVPTCQQMNNFENRFSFNSLKEIIIKDDMSVQLNILKQPIINIPPHIVVHNNISSKQELEDMLSSIHTAVRLCCGSNNSENEMKNIGYSEAFTDILGTLRHKKCLLILSTELKKCKFCCTLNKSVKQKLRRSKLNTSGKRIKIVVSDTLKQKKIVALHRKFYRAQKARKRANYILEKLRKEFADNIIKMKEISETNVITELKKKEISQNQILAVQEIIQASKHKNMKGHRYNEEWMLLCMLLHMKSPKAYAFLRENSIVPIPCIRTIRRYLSLIDVSCGFDMKFFEMFKMSLRKKKDDEKHGVLLIDEINLRESINVNSKNLTYRGLVDFGSEGTQATDIQEKANHGLVIMFQPLKDNYSQPVAVFASKGCVKGEVLAQLIIKAIALLENINVKIHGIITDGAATNRKFWSEMGISGKIGNLINSFEHPTVNGRSVYVFSDTPHLIKTIRNRLYSTPLQLDPNGKIVKWDYFVALFNKDKSLPAQMRICPKLTNNHIALTNTGKMRVHLATQIFSKSVTYGLRFYKNFLPELQDSDDTANFCEWINNLFDALNRNKISEGLTVDNADFKILQQSLEKLDTWEQYVHNGTISEKNFLTKQTAEGLRVTIKSTLDLVKYLTNFDGFPSVLTGRLNQDPLEV